MRQHPLEGLKGKASQVLVEASLKFDNRDVGERFVKKVMKTYVHIKAIFDTIAMVICGGTNQKIKTVYRYYSSSSSSE